MNKLGILTSGFVGSLYGIQVLRSPHIPEVPRRQYCCNCGKGHSRSNRRSFRGRCLACKRKPHVNYKIWRQVKKYSLIPRTLLVSGDLYDTLSSRFEPDSLLDWRNI